MHAAFAAVVLLRDFPFRQLPQRASLADTKRLFRLCRSDCYLLEI